MAVDSFINICEIGSRKDHMLTIITSTITTIIALIGSKTNQHLGLSS